MSKKVYLMLDQSVDFFEGGFEKLQEKMEDIKKQWPNYYNFQFTIENYSGRMNVNVTAWKND